MHLNSLFFFFPLKPIECWNFSSANVDFLKGSLIRDWFLSQSYPESPGPWLRGVEGGSWEHQDTQPGLRSDSPLLDVQMDNPLPSSLGLWCWIPQHPQRHFVDVSQVFFAGVAKMRDILCHHWCWHHSCLQGFWEVGYNSCLCSSIGDFRSLYSFGFSQDVSLWVSAGWIWHA